MKFLQQLEAHVSIHEDSLKNELDESSVISTLDHLTRFTARDIADFAFLHMLVLFILKQDFEGAVIVKGHATRTMAHGGFKNFTLSCTDLYVYFHVIFGGERARLKKTPANDLLWHKITVAERDIKDMLTDMRTGRQNDAKDFKFLYNLEKDLKIEDSNYRSCRRLILSWNDITNHDQKLVITRLLQALRIRSPRSDLLKHLEDFSVRKDLEIKNAKNPEIHHEAK